ncbi:hypothetical protein ACNKHR_10655 [Shigella flexneri]
MDSCGLRRLSRRDYRTVERKMVINVLNANVKVFMADFEDSLAPD